MPASGHLLSVDSAPRTGGIFRWCSRLGQIRLALTCLSSYPCTILQNWRLLVYVQATSTLSKAQAEAAKHASQCSKLEADIVGHKSWVRELEKTEQAYLKAIRCAGSHVAAVLPRPLPLVCSAG